MYTLLGAGEIRTPTVQGKYGMGDVRSAVVGRRNAR
jgi:hypothetical protein